jgi:alkyl hydroperoxide reductase subunit AhpF
LIIPKRQASDARSVYLVDNDGLHPVELKENASRQDVTSAPAIVQRRPAAERVAKKRSWEKEALIIGGSAGGGAAIGAIAGGKKGAGIGAAAGGVGGLIYDVLTRNKK